MGWSSVGVAWIAKYWFGLMLAGLLAWWFFTGETVVNVGRSLIGRGRKLSDSHLDADGNVIETPEQIQAQIIGALGRPVELDAVIMARVGASESPGATERERAAIQWVLRNDAESHGWSIAFTAYKAGGAPDTFGTQAGRRYATTGGGRREIHEADLFMAEAILAGQVADPTGGATKFVHYTGYRRFVDFLAAHPKVQAWIDAGARPVALGDVGTLIVFIGAGDALPPGSAYA